MDSEQFRALLLAELPALRAYALVVARTRGDADDLAQDTVERAWRFQHSFKPGTRIRSWLFTICRNAFYDRGRKGRNTVEDVDGEHAAALVFAADQEWRAEYAEMLDALAELSPASRHALLLVLGLGLSYEEAAMVCECPVTTVKSRVSRGRLRLVEILESRRPMASRKA